MFKGGYGGLELTGDHLDISYRAPDAWPSLTPLGSIRSFTFDIGDPVAGPSIQLGLNTPHPDEQLDWKHSIDPVHHHGSDQFRVVSGGEWILANRPIPAGGFAFQEAGWVYQEHPGSDTEPTWLALLMADRRGMISTLHFGKDHDTVFAAGAEYGQPVPADVPYPHPAGNKGLAAIATTRGPCRRGYLYGDESGVTPGETVTGLLGDAVAGPVVHMIGAQPAAIAVPECAYATEVVLIVARGACRIGDTRYVGGQLRVQAAGAPFAVVAGEDGCELAMIVGDRRAAITVADDARPGWMNDAASLRDGLEPVAGGTWRKIAAAA